MRKKKPTLIPPTDYDVGHRKPPAHTRFPPGQSGNPNGRPKGSRNKPEIRDIRLIDTLRQEAKRPVTYFDGGKKVKTTAIAAVMRRVFAEALRGKISAARLIAAGLTEGDRWDQRQQEMLLDEVTKYIHDWSLVPKRHRPPDLVPDPEHLVIDAHSGQVRCFGPFYPWQKPYYDLLKAKHAELQVQLDALITKLKSRRIGQKRRIMLMDEIIEKDSLLKLIEHEFTRDWIAEPPTPVLKDKLKKQG